MVSAKAISFAIRSIHRSSISAASRNTASSLPVNGRFVKRRDGRTEKQALASPLLYLSEFNPRFPRVRQAKLSLVVPQGNQRIHPRRPIPGHAIATTASKPVIVAYVRRMNAKYVHTSRSAAIGSTFVARRAGK
jgi:hypothetical protein